MSKPENNETSNNLYRPYVPGDSISLNLNENSQKTASEALFSYALVKFLTTALICPFEVARILLQIQHLPISSQKEQEDQSDSEYSSDESGDESFGQQRNPADKPTSSSIAPGKIVATDQYGYVVESSVDKATLPPHQLPILRSGIWDAIKTIIKHPDEGFFSLWKGTTSIP
ncbi:hypothetical protein DSO57_1002909 [Entomophthora muscae]|uniref:Uncharacterized protein n=1 Tax=Entomophthora muscae TaxID=34485 RepID=A0ACC2SLR3_9FUNG|nr:hypothetical protein DSO57_1002909 [Entomophthora muscae]